MDKSIKLLLILLKTALSVFAVALFLLMFSSDYTSIFVNTMVRTGFVVMITLPIYLLVRFTDAVINVFNKD